MPSVARNCPLGCVLSRKDNLTSVFWNVHQPAVSAWPWRCQNLLSCKKTKAFHTWSDNIPGKNGQLPSSQPLETGGRLAACVTVKWEPRCSSHCLGVSNFVWSGQNPPFTFWCSHRKCPLMNFFSAPSGGGFSVALLNWKKSQHFLMDHSQYQSTGES